MTPEQADLLIAAINNLTGAVNFFTAEFTIGIAAIFAALFGMLFFKNMGGRRPSP